MQSVVATKYGSLDDVALMDLDPRPAGPTDVRVAVRAAGVNPADLAVLAGYMQPYFPAEPPVVLGYDVAGVVEAVGADVEDLAVGDPVVGWLVGEELRSGSFAEHVVAAADAFVPLPPGVGFTLAAALPHAAMAAAQAVDEVLAIAPGETVLIHAAAGGVGTVAVQLARRAGATVLGTCSADNDDYLRGLGAVPIRYDRSIVDQVNAVAPDGVDAVLDLIGNDELQDSISVLKPDGRLASTANFGVGALGGQLVAGHLDRKRLAGLVSLLAEGDLTIRLAEQYDLADARAALEHVAGGHAKGKIVITVSAG